MNPLTQTIRGQLLYQESLPGLLLDVTPPPEERPAHNLVYVRYALVVRGSERHVFPGLVLDDWGRERKTLSLYRWLFEEGQRFPRAELFGWHATTGEQTQIFLRDLEIFFKYPCYAFTATESPVQDGERLHAVFIPDASHEGVPQQSEIPSGIPWPLRHASVLWQKVNPETLSQYGWQAA
ncbi:MAG TPA: hypothetical protein VK879_07415 [Candidatus Sulfomarinibacteraceae bacterium]|nr:hypothetical protein [Candidatus Sulfomarinibacteraceae bacterium]